MIYKKALELHQKNKGKITITSKIPLETKEDLSLAYTPGVAEISRQIVKDPSLIDELTSRGNTVAIISDGSAVLGLGNIGPKGAYPVMEGKALLFKKFGNIDAIPLVLETQDTEEIIKTIKYLAPSFAGINLEDISAPRCFEIADRLQDLGIPVFHDDQYGTAIVVYAGIINALKVTGRKPSESKAVISGAGAAGISIAKILKCEGFNNCEALKDIILIDSKGIISKERTDLNESKKEALTYTNNENLSGKLEDALKGADIFIGVSKGGLLNKEMVKTMAKDSIIFAMANPDPEILPEEAKEGGAKIIATGRSDYPNQVNNVLAFPGIFRGAIDAKSKRITKKMMIAAAKAIAETIKPTPEEIIPSVFNKEVTKNVAKKVKEAVE